MQLEERLIYKIIGDDEPSRPLNAAPELTSDKDSGRPISDRYGIPREHFLKADEVFLFFDKIYSTYTTTPKRFLDRKSVV